jgi:hypothetical protein
VITKKDKEAAASLLAEIKARREYEAAAEEEQWRTDPALRAAAGGAVARNEQRHAEARDERARAIISLIRKGVFLDIGGCGCCGSPRVRIEIDGELLVDAENFELEMITEEDDKGDP